MAEPRTDYWAAMQFRFTTFLNPEDPSVAKDWWQQTVGEAPDKSVLSKGGQAQCEGTHNGGKLVLSVHPVRVDWVFSPQEPEEFPDEVPTLGPVEAVLPGFSELTTNWLRLPSVSAAQRVAFGAVLAGRRYNSRVDAYKEMASLLDSVTLDPNGSSDFLYQINRWRQSRCSPKTTINRLSKWSVLAFQTLILAPGGPSVAAIQHHCRLELDINTAPVTGAVLDPTLMEPLAAELTAFAMEIAGQGDIA